MLTRDDNELMCRVGRGTAMGDLLRQYWMPFLPSTELPEPDCPPKKVRLLGEDLVAFRDTRGRVGLLAAQCLHRGASLFFGRNEECGIRCVYHGWKFDVSGRCLDMPNEPLESNFKEKIRLQAYPCREYGGLIWAYLGPASSMPPLPELEWATLPDDQRCVSKRLQESNYLQALEGAVDLSHVVFLHRSLDRERGRDDLDLARHDPSPILEVFDTAGGLVAAARRNADEGRYYWRANQYVLPWYTMFPPLVDQGIGGHAFVPI